MICARRVTEIRLVCPERGCIDPVMTDSLNCDAVTEIPPSAVINALTPAAFISKAEVRQWPLIGWLSAVNETVFLRRGSRGHARIINEEIARCMQAGRHVAL